MGAVAGFTVATVTIALPRLSMPPSTRCGGRRRERPDVLAHAMPMRNLQWPAAALPDNPAGTESSEGLAPRCEAPMTAPDAIRRAQAWLAATTEPCERCDELGRQICSTHYANNDDLAALGPASVALAAALQEILDEEDAWTGVSSTVLKRADAALTKWTEAVTQPRE